MSYSKHKDRKPQDTIFAVQEILNKAGLYPVMKWVNPIYEGVYSNRVELHPSHLGTNGKGTDEVYAAASGYAELMERLQNNMLSLHAVFTRTIGKKHGFYTSPDEQLMPIAEVLRDDNHVHDYIFTKLGLNNVLEREYYLSYVARTMYGLTDGTIPVLPFADLESGKILMIAPNLVWYAMGSNGMAAGNTIEEAMVQGLSEIYERYAQKMVLMEGAVPPRIPDEYLQEYSFWPLLEAMKEDTGYDIGLYDCSLGKGCPVVACIAVDRSQGTFGIKFGSHPSFAVAAERTLTEAMQGRTRLQGFTSLSRAGSQAEAAMFHNPANTCKTGTGIYPMDMFIKEPGWEFVPWPKDNFSNAEFLQHMLALLKELGFKALARDVSFLGFPSCFILVPGMSEIYQLSPLQRRLLHNTFAINEFFHRFPDLTREEEEKILNMIRFKEGSVLENQMDFICMVPVKGRRMSSPNVGGFLAYKHGKLELAIHFFNQLYLTEEDAEEKTVLGARLEYIRALAVGYSHEDTAKLIRSLFTAKAADRVIGEMQEPDKVMERVFPQPKCTDCEHCELKGKECDYQELEVTDTIFTALAKGEKVSQEALLERLKALGV